MEEENPKSPSSASVEQPVPTREEIEQAFGFDAENPICEPANDIKKNKSKKPIAIAVGVIAGMTLLGGGCFYFLRQSKTELNDLPQANQDIAPAEKLSISKLRMPGNSLSDFDLAFLKLEDAETNKIYSPLSIKYALAMLADASNGDSKTQITNLIGDYAPKAYLNSENRSLANGMFIKDFYNAAVLDSYKETVKSKYNADVVIDAFDDASPLNNWIENKTLGIIDNILEDSDAENLKFMLVNALAIDMEWEEQLQHIGKAYGTNYAHEDYSDYLPVILEENDFETITFNEKENVKTAHIAANVNRYNIIEELGEDYIRSTVQEKYNEWLEEEVAQSEHPGDYDTSFDLDGYMTDLAANYGKASESTDFYFSESDSEKVFAKDLKEYDGSTLQYVAIMPKAESLSNYIAKLDAEQFNTLIDGLKDASVDNFKDGVITKIKGYIPFFKFNYDLDLCNDLQALGINDVFSSKTADLSAMLNVDLSSEDRPFIDYARHKADIDFSNDGIKAAAVTAAGGMGSAGSLHFDYLWDVPVEEIDLTFDNPFVFIIRDKMTGEVWFTGTVYEL